LIFASTVVRLSNSRSLTHDAAAAAAAFDCCLTSLLYPDITPG